MIPHRGTEITEKKQSLRVLCGFVRDFFYDPTQRHRDHREKQSLRVLCGFVWDIGLRPSPESVIIRTFFQIHFCDAPRNTFLSGVRYRDTETPLIISSRVQKSDAPARVPFPVCIPLRIGLRR